MRIAILAFFVGVVAVQVLPTLPSAHFLWLLLPILALTLASRRALPLLLFALGVVWAVVRADLVLREQLPTDLEGRDIHLIGTVDDVPRASERGVRFPFSVQTATVDNRVVTVPSRILLSGYDPAFAPQVGEVWRLSARLKRAHATENPGEADYEAYLLRNRLRALGYVRPDPAPQRLLAARRYGIDRTRAAVGDGVRSALAGDDFAGFIVAFANGDESGIVGPQWEVLQRTGTVHLIAISGMNVSFVAGIAFWLLRRAWSRSRRAMLYWPAPKAAAVGAFAVAVVYTALAGFAVPTQRALVMLGVALGGVIVQRRWSPSYTLTLALAAVLLFDPLSVLAPGFWLSFASVAVIVFTLAASRDERGWRQWGRVQLAIGIGLLPLMMLLFQRTALIAPLANALAIPVIELAVIPLTLIAIAALAVWPALASVSLKVAALALHLLWPVLTWLAQFDILQWTQPAVPWWVMASALLGAAWLIAPRGWPARWVGAVWLLPMLLWRPPAPLAGEAWTTVLDVGQGLAVVVRTAHHALLFDAGPRPTPQADSGRLIVLPYLRQVGVAHLDTVIVSHDHADHSGGVAAVRTALPVDQVLASVTAPLPGANACRRGQAWEWDGVRFTMLNPEPALGEEGNNACCVLLVSTRYGQLLLPADIEARTERRLSRDIGPVAVLVAPHHGSKTSSSPPFVSTLRPQVTIFSVGYRNRYRHPHPAVLTRYRDAGSAVYETPTTGAMTLQLGSQGLQVDAYRTSHRRYWYDD